MDFLAHLHPEVVHFPIAFFLIYVLLEITGTVLKKDFFSKAAHLFLFLGVLGAVAAVLTGNAAESAANGLAKEGLSIPKEAIGHHEDYATFTLWYFSGLLVLRTMYVLKKKYSGKIKYLFIVLSIIGGLLIFKTGQFGGKLVYKYGIGTDLKKSELNK